MLAQGLIDVVVQQKFRIILFGYLTEKTPMLLFSAGEFIKYVGNTFTGANNTITIHFPTFNFRLSSNDHFEFDISPGSSTDLPISWSFETATLASHIQLSDHIQILPVSDTYILPARATDGSAGYDVCSSEAVEIQPNTTVKIPLGYKMSYPSDLVCHLCPRSSLSLKGIHVSLGTIDVDYRGPVAVILSNTTESLVSFNIGQRIGQFVFSKISLPPITTVKFLSKTVGM